VAEYLHTSDSSHSGWLAQVWADDSTNKLTRYRYHNPTEYPRKVVVVPVDGEPITEQLPANVTVERSIPLNRQPSAQTQISVS
jgi:hypothetical protein